MSLQFGLFKKLVLYKKEYNKVDSTETYSTRASLMMIKFYPRHLIIPSHPQPYPLTPKKCPATLIQTKYTSIYHQKSPPTHKKCPPTSTYSKYISAYPHPPTHKRCPTTPSYQKYAPTSPHSPINNVHPPPPT